VNFYVVKDWKKIGIWQWRTMTGRDPREDWEPDAAVRLDGGLHEIEWHHYLSNRSPPSDIFLHLLSHFPFALYIPLHSSFTSSDIY